MPRQPYLQAIESETLLDGRFSNIIRIDHNGGNGHFSLLFIADDQDTGEKVALKFFDPTRYDADRVARFEREGDILSRFIDEPYVINCVNGGVKVFNKTVVDQASGLQIPLPLKYIAMELATSSVEDFIYGSTPPPPLMLLKCFKEMVKAVFRFHTKQVCHRDLKPSNFLICNNQVKLSDLGTAKCMNGTMPDIASRYINPVGDMRYCGPELFMSVGIADELVFRSDLFALGAILFEMFTFVLLTPTLYNRNFMGKISQMNAILAGMNPKDRLFTFRGSIGSLTAQVSYPDIFAYNNTVPKCIKITLNRLYKKLAHINPEERPYNSTSIHRSIDICILTLENEIKYHQWLQNKRTRRQRSEEKQQSKLEMFSC